MIVVSRQHIINECNDCDGSPGKTFRSVRTGFDCSICDKCYEVIEYIKPDNVSKKRKKNRLDKDSLSGDSKNLFD